MKPSPLNDEKFEELIQALHKAINTVAIGHQSSDVVCALGQLAARAIGSGYSGTEDELAGYLADFNEMVNRAAYSMFKYRTTRN